MKRIVYQFNCIQHNKIANSQKKKQEKKIGNRKVLPRRNTAKVFTVLSHHIISNSVFGHKLLQKHSRSLTFSLAWEVALCKPGISPVTKTSLETSLLTSILDPTVIATGTAA